MPQVVLLVLWPVIYLALYLMYMCMSVRALRQHSWIHHRVSGSLVRLQVHSLPFPSSLCLLCTTARCLLVQTMNPALTLCLETSVVVAGQGCRTRGYVLAPGDI